MRRVRWYHNSVYFEGMNLCYSIKVLIDNNNTVANSFNSVFFVRLLTLSLLNSIRY